MSIYIYIYIFIYLLWTLSPSERLNQIGSNILTVIPWVLTSHEQIKILKLNVRKNIANPTWNWNMSKQHEAPWIPRVIYISTSLNFQSLAGLKSLKVLKFVYLQKIIFKICISTEQNIWGMEGDARYECRISSSFNRNTGVTKL